MDPASWQPQLGGHGWGNQELQYYTNSSANAALDGAGNLAITVRRTDPQLRDRRFGGCPYTSARLVTKDRVSCTYGLVQARIRLPQGRGVWLYVQLSRARQDTRLYAVVGPEPQGAGELDLPDRDQPDAYLQLAHVLARAGGQRLAIDTPSSPDLQLLSTRELRTERDRLRRQLDQAPRDRSRELAQATTHRQQAEEALAAHQQPGGRQPPGMLRWLFRR